MVFRFQDAACSKSCFCSKDEGEGYYQQELGIRQCTCKHLVESKDDGKIMMSLVNLTLQLMKYNVFQQCTKIGNYQELIKFEIQKPE